MIVAAISLMLVSLCLVAAVAMLPVILKMLLYGVATIFVAAGYVVKYTLRSVPWIISAGGALTFLFYALGRQFFTGEDAKVVIERKLTPRDRQKTLSLLTIEFMLELRKFLAAL